MMKRISVRTRSREELRDITGGVLAAVRASAVRAGVVHLWSRVCLAEWGGPRTREIGAIVVASE